MILEIISSYSIEHFCDINFKTHLGEIEKIREFHTLNLVNKLGNLRIWWLNFKYKENDLFKNTQIDNQNIKICGGGVEENWSPTSLFVKQLNLYELTEEKMFLSFFVSLKLNERYLFQCWYFISNVLSLYFDFLITGKQCCYVMYPA